MSAVETLMSNQGPDGSVTVSVTDFKTHCLALFDKLEDGQVSSIRVTRRGHPIVEARTIAKPAAGPLRFEDVWGCMEGTIEFAPDYDPYEQVISDPEG